MADPERSADRISVAAVLIDLVAALSEPYGPSDLAQRLVDGCVDLLDVSAAGLLLADPGSTPKILAASTHEAAVLELVQVNSGQGPCLAAIASDEIVSVNSLDDVAEVWPEWVAAARTVGIRQAYGIPLHRDGQTIGALNLFRTDETGLQPEDAAVARALADVATIGILTRRAMDRAASINAQLQYALESRVVIEQAKGLLAEREQISVVDAFVRLRHQARATSTPLTEVARALVESADDGDR